jgi:hypothetical protein
MKKILAAMLFITAISVMSSCKKEEDEGKLPNIAFKTGAGYTSADATVAQNTTVTIGINASKSEPNDVLKTFDASKILDGGASASFYSEVLTGTLGDTYSKDLTITTRSVAGTEKYTFTVVNKDGLKNQVSLTLTVN